jgi:hypothetical protein
MKFQVKPFFRLVWLMLFFMISVSTAKGSQSLAKIFKAGKIEISQDIVITDENLPEEDFFQNPRGIVAHPDGNIYVADFDAHNIKIISPAGKLIKVIGHQGQGPGDFHAPSFIDFAGDRLIVWEVMNRRFSVLDKEGRFVKTVPFDFENGRPEGMKALPDGRIIVLTEKQIEINNILQQCYSLFLLSSDLEIEKTIYSRTLQKRKLITEPMRMYVPQPFTPFVYWDTTQTGHIVLGSSDKYEIEVHDPDKGKLFSFSHGYLPVKVTEEDKNFHFSIFTIAVYKGDTREVKQGAPDYIKKNTAFPKLKPAFKNIITDDEGNIWVQLYHEDRKRDERVFDVFDDKGEFIKSVEISGDTTFPAPSFKVTRIKNKTFWKIETGEDGFHRIVRYRIGD